MGMCAQRDLMRRIPSCVNEDNSRGGRDVQSQASSLGTDEHDVVVRPIVEAVDHFLWVQSVRKDGECQQRTSAVGKAETNSSVACCMAPDVPLATGPQ